MSDPNDYLGSFKSQGQSGINSPPESSSPAIPPMSETSPEPSTVPSSPDISKLHTVNTMSSATGVGLNISASPDVSSATTAGPTVAHSTYLLEDPKLREIMLSDVGIECLVSRLKQSVHSAREFANYVKKRASIEADRLGDIKKLSRLTRDAVKKPDGRQGTFVRQMDEMMGINDRLSDTSHTLVMALHGMHDELLELAKTNEKSRKALKETCLRHEKNVIDAEQNADKARSKYVSLCEEMERLKDPNKTKFGFKSKNTPQHEQELQTKISTAESDYRQKVSTVQRLRKELVSQLRPQNIKQLKDHILECDSGISLQLQKYATLHETLALNSGFIVCPLKPAGSTTAPLSMKEIAAKVDNELDFYNDILKIPNLKKQLNRPEVQFIQHPYMSTASTFSSTLSPSISRPVNAGSTGTTSVGTTSQFNTIASPTTPKTGTFSSTTSNNRNSMLLGATVGAGVAAGVAAGSAIGSGVGAANSTAAAVSTPKPPYPTSGGPMFQEDVTTPKNERENPLTPSFSPPNIPAAGSSLDTFRPDQPTTAPLPAMNSSVMPSFGTSLDDIIEHEALPDPVPVPRVVSQCVSAIDRFGLDVEGIYRHAGNPGQIQVLKRLFDTDPASVDLTQPGRYGINDIHAVSGTLKLYFQELPDPLLTQQFHHEFIEAAKIDNDWQRRDAVHEVVNKLADSNYTVLRYLVFHLNKVQKREAVNRMGIIHLGNMWGSVLMATDHDNINEMALQARVIETILYNCDHIFEAEDE